MGTDNGYLNSSATSLANLTCSVTIPVSQLKGCSERPDHVLADEDGGKVNGNKELKNIKNPVNMYGTKENICLRSSVEQLNTANRKASTETSVFSYSIVPSELVLSDCVNSTQDLSKYNTKRKKTFCNALPEIIASCSATSFHIMVGVTFAATASLLPQLEEENSDIKATKSQIAWIASIFVLVVPLGSIISGFIMETFGRLIAVKLSIVPSVASCILIALSTDVYMLIAGRFLMGIGAALGTNPAVVYITEITSPEYRGALVSAGPTLSSLGMMLGYLSGAFLPWRTVSWINIAYCLIPLLLIVLLFVPESPAWLITKGRVEQARQSLMWLTKSERDENVREKIVERKLKELMTDKEEKLSKAKGRSVCRRLSGLGRPTGYKPLLIMVILFAFQQYTGVYITTFYAVQFFQSAGSSMNPFHASILIGLTRFVMSVATVFLLKLFGRRPLCITSCIGMAIFMGISGYFTRSVTNTGETSMIPVYSILLYVCFCMIGLLSLPWTMAAEVFPMEIRGLAHGLVIASAHVIMFISVKSYYEMAEFFGGHDALQWFFGTMSLFALVFVYFFLPETHSLTLSQIEDYFQMNTVYILRKKGEDEEACKKERGMSLKNVEILECVPENNSECDTLVIKQMVPVSGNPTEKDSESLDLTKTYSVVKSQAESAKMTES